MTVRKVTSSYIVLLLLLGLVVPISSLMLPGAHATTWLPGTAALSVPSGSPPITAVTPAVAGTTVAITGSGWNASQVCGVTAKAASGSVFLIEATSCSISSGGALSASFRVAAGSLYSTAHSLRINYTVVAPTVGVVLTFSVVPQIVASPSAAIAGTSVAVYGSGYTGGIGPLTCALTAGGPVPASPPSTCAETSDGKVSALFVALNVAIGFYIIELAETAPGTESALTPFTLTGSPTSPIAAFTPAFGPTGTLVTVTGSNWNPSDTTVSFQDNATVTPVGPLTITPVVCPASAGVIGSCSFTVRPDAIGGTHFVNATGTLGDTFTLQFIVQSTFIITPDSGRRGDTGVISGSGYLTSAGNASCKASISESTPTFDWAGHPAATMCQVSDHGVLTGYYKIAATALGGLRSIIINNATLVQQGSLTVPFEVTATVTLTPSSGRAGTNVLVLGSNFAAGDTTCTLSSNPSGLFASSACAISGAGNVSASFIVASGASGPYTVTVTGTTGDFGSATFTAALAPTLVLNPTSGQTGTLVSASGANYVGTVCILTASPSSLFTSQSCSVAGGVLTGSFTVALDASPGTVYTVSTNTNVEETATATFIVNAGPTSSLVLTPVSGPVGTVVSGHSSGFPTDTTCVLSSSPSGLMSSPSCAVAGGNVTVGFTISSGASPGGYAVQVTGNTGRSASATFTVTATPLFSLSANPSSLVVGQGGTGSVLITLLSSGAFASPVTLSATLPAGVTGGFSPNPVTPPAGGTVTSTLSIGVSGTAPSSTTAITITGISGTMTAATAISLVIQSTVTTATTTSQSTTTAPWTPGKPCIIATVTFGSEVSPAVQLLRNFRDGLVLQTRAGSAFMEVFNTWYYSFSPSVANFIADNDPLRAPIRVALYPLLGILSISTFAYSIFSWTPEFAVLITGFVASSLIGLVYFTPIALVAMRTLMRRRRLRGIDLLRGSLLVLAAALSLLVAGELAGSFLALAIASSVIVLTCIFTVPVAAAMSILKLRQK